MQQTKYSNESLTFMTQMVLPNDTNTMNNLMGGILMRWMDIASAIAAQKHSNCNVVTASVDNISFSRPVPLGNVVTLKAQVTRAFHTSMEIKITVWAEDIPKGKRILANTAFFTFVAIDDEGKPQNVPALVPQTEEEKLLFEEAARRRELRLLLSKRKDLDDNSDLQKYFKKS